MLFIVYHHYRWCFLACAPCLISLSQKCWQSRVPGTAKDKISTRRKRRQKKYYSSLLPIYCKKNKKMRKQEPLRLIEDVNLLIDSILFQDWKNDQTKISVRQLCPASLMHHFLSHGQKFFSGESCITHRSTSRAFHTHTHVIHDQERQIWPSVKTVFTNPAHST